MKATKKTEIKELKEEIKSLRERLTTQGTVQGDQSAEILALQKQMTKLKAKFGKLEQDFQVYSSKLHPQALEDQLREDAQAITTLQSEIGRLKKVHAELHVDVSEIILKLQN